MRYHDPSFSTRDLVFAIFCTFVATLLLVQMNVSSKMLADTHYLEQDPPTPLLCVCPCPFSLTLTPTP